jgi:hypothetical protein
MPAIKRTESLIDRALRFAPLLPPPARLAAARAAAGRGLGPPALRAAPGDPLVLARLGMHLKAAAASGGGRGGAIGRAAGLAASGALEQAHAAIAALSPLATAEARFIAASAAPNDPAWALALLQAGDLAERAACALAVGDYHLAERCLAGAPASQQTRYLAGALAAWRGDWRAARTGLDHAFAADGLAPPFDPGSDAPTTLEAFAESPPPKSPVGEQPLVSVVIAARDAASTLAMAVRSILAQTWRNLEVLIVDDGSADGTASVAADLGGADPRVCLMQNTRAAGPYGARNTAIAAARGAFIALHDADDWAHPQKIERQMAAIGRARAGSLCRHIRIDDLGRPLAPRVFPFARLSPITLVAAAEAFARVGPFDEVATGADSEWIARADERLGRRATPRLPAVMLVALWRPGSLSHSPTSGLIGEGIRARIAYVEAWRQRHARAAAAS